MLSQLNKIISYKKSFTPKNLIYSKVKKHYLNDIENSTDSTDQQYESKALLNKEKNIGNYTLTKQIDKSSYTKIFIAKHILTGENVNIRIINKQLFKNDLLSMTRFYKELEIIKIVKHPNIIKLLEIIETNSKLYLISEYLPYNLLSYIESKKKLSENKARHFFQQLISALNYLHIMGISHRNIKPENILLDKKKTKLKITGFGVSTFCKDGSLLNSPVGNLIYAPPEMILSKKYKGELNDIWDAGIVLYAMVCGYLPFSQDNQDININHIIEGFYDIPKEINSDCSEVIKACLECDPKKRITFNKLKDLKWINYNNFNYTKGINIKKEKIIVDDIILQECKKYISANNQDIINKIKKSVIENQFDEFSSLYHLVLERKIKKGYQSIYDWNKNNFLYNFINLTNNNEEFNSDKEDLSNYSSHTHTNSFSSFISNKNKLSFSDILNTRNKINNNIFYKTIRNSQSNNKNIININSTNFKNEFYFLSQKKSDSNTNIHFQKKELNRLKSSELKVNKIEMVSSPKIYRKKTKLIAKPKFLNTKSKSNQKNYIKINSTSTEKIKFTEENNSKNNYGNTQPVNTLFVNRVKNFNNYYSIQKNKNKSSDRFHFVSKSKNIYYKTKVNLQSINKKNLFININNNENYNEKNDNNIDKILMEDQPVANFSINFNNTVLNNTNKNIKNDFNKKELTMNNFNKNETNYTNCQSSLKKNKKSIKSYKRLDYYFETPKPTRHNSNYFKYDHKCNLKNNNYFNLNISNKRNLSISDSFNKYIPSKKVIRSSVLRNSMNEQYYNTAMNPAEKTLNKIKSFGGLTINTKKPEINLKTIFNQNNFTAKGNDSSNIKYLELTDKNPDTEKENKKIEINLIPNFSLNNNEKSIIIDDLGVLDLTCLKFSIYNDLVEKICKTLKKNKIKYCFINQNKIHCSSKTGLFFDIEINNLKTKKNNKNIKSNSKAKNNKITVQKMGFTTFGFKKQYGKNEDKKNRLFYITFYCKKNDFKKNNAKLIYDIVN